MNKRSKNEEDRNKDIFSYAATDGKSFDFTEDAKLLNFAEDLYKADLKFDEAEKEQENMLEKIDKLKKRINLITGSRKPKESNKKNGKYC